MNLLDPIDSLERGLRDLIEAVLRREHGHDWLRYLGASEERVGRWEERREEESKRRPGGDVEQRLLAYSDFHDLVQIIDKQWEKGFKACFKDKQRFRVYADRLEAFRNPSAHARTLLPFERHLVQGMTGELRQEITLFFSAGTGGAEPEHFARIEEVTDNFGTRVVGMSASGHAGRPKVVLRPGDEVSFAARAWDPEGNEVRWKIYLMTRGEFLHFTGGTLDWVWEIREEDISEQSQVKFEIESPRHYSRTQHGTDDSALMIYRILPSLNT